MGLKTPTDLKPKVVAAIQLENHQRKLLVKATGLDVALFREKKGSLESSLNANVQNICVSERDKSIFEILLSEKNLPKEIQFNAQKCLWNHGRRRARAFDGKNLSYLTLRVL